MLAHALQYLNRASIIPVGQNKLPLVKWKEFQERKATPDEVKEWWTKWPDANIGIITGKISDIAVVDVEKGGDTTGLPETTIVKTGGGGWHYYYRYCEGVENRARIRPLTDIRGEGGYVVCPPSLHASGQKYEWIKKYGNLTPFPKHLFGLKEKQNWTEIASGVNDGYRNESAASYIGKLMSIFEPDTWENTVWETTRLWNEKNNPSLPERELRTTYESIKQRAIKNPRPILTKFVTLTEVIKRGKEEVLNIKPEDIVSFGYDWLDDQLTGFFPGELVVVGGETGTGKTTWVTNIIYKTSKQRKCAIFALEDRLNDYGIKRLYFEIGRIRRQEGLKNYYWNTYRRNVIPNQEQFLKEINQAEKNLANDNVEFAEVEEQMNIDLLEKLMQQQVDRGVSLFLIDHLHYLNLLRGDITKTDYIEKVMIRMKMFLNRTGARMILVVHYKKLDGKKPKLDSFKDSISIAQNANYTIHLWRDRTDANSENRYKTTFFIPKSRNPNGEGSIEVEFDPETNDYKNISKWQFGTPTEEPQEINIDEIL